MASAVLNRALSCSNSLICHYLSSSHYLNKERPYFLYSRVKRVDKVRGSFTVRVRADGQQDTKESPAPVKKAPKRLTDEERERRRQIEDELKDARTPFDYLAPRPLRRLYFAAGAVSCTVATLVALSRLIKDPSLELAEGGGTTLGINALGLVVFAGLYFWEGKQAKERVERRKVLRERQIKTGDREVFVNADGEKMSRLKPVDDEWILRRLDRWGQQDYLPQIGPKKGAILQQLVADAKPGLIVEVGTFLGYSAIRMAQTMPPDCRIVSFEKDFKWAFAAKRFVWQAKLSDRVDVQWKEALSGLQKLAEKAAGPDIDFLFLDAKPSEYLSYLQGAEARLAPGAVVVADNAGVFKEQLAEYLSYVRSSGRYESRYIGSTLEYRDDVPDGLEVSVYRGQ